MAGRIWSEAPHSIMYCNGIAVKLFCFKFMCSVLLKVKVVSYLQVEHRGILGSGVDREPLQTARR